MFNATVTLHPDYDRAARRVEAYVRASDVEGDPPTLTVRVQELHGNSKTEVNLYGSVVAVLEQLDQMTAAASAAIKEAHAGPTLPEPVGNAA